MFGQLISGFDAQHNKSHRPTARARQLEILIQVLNLDKVLDFIPGDSCSQSSLLNREDGCTCPQ